MSRRTIRAASTAAVPPGHEVTDAHVGSAGRDGGSVAELVAAFREAGYNVRLLTDFGDEPSEGSHHLDD